MRQRKLLPCLCRQVAIFLTILFFPLNVWPQATRVFGLGEAPSVYATVDLTGQTAAIGATTIYAVPATDPGMYRITWNAKVTTPATTSSVLGGAGGFQITYTDADDSVALTPLAVPNALATGNSTATQLSGVVAVNAKASTNIQYHFGYTSVGATVMVYSLHIKLEKM